MVSNDCSYCQHITAQGLAHSAQLGNVRQSSIAFSNNEQVVTVAIASDNVGYVVGIVKVVVKVKVVE